MSGPFGCFPEDGFEGFAGASSGFAGGEPVDRDQLLARAHCLTMLELAGEFWWIDRVALRLVHAQRIAQRADALPVCPLSRTNGARLTHSLTEQPCGHETPPAGILSEDGVSAGSVTARHS